MMIDYIRALRATLLTLFIVALTNCASTPPEVNRVKSSRLTDPQATIIGLATDTLSESHPNTSGHVVLDTGQQAFTARIAVAASAEKTLDAQYYIWNDDATGRVLAHQLVVAADRGVPRRLSVFWQC
jgi:putative cardiolipin synthase